MATEPHNLYLVGYRCTGKSRAGRLMAERLRWHFADSDQVVESQAGRTIDQIVAGEGWPGFRKRERVALRQLCLHCDTVVATGGGVVLNSENVDDMRRTGHVVWLRAEIETIAARMQADAQRASQRPSLTGQSAMAEIESVLAERETLYQAAADYIVKTDRLSLLDVAERVVDWFGPHHLKS